MTTYTPDGYAAALQRFGSDVLARPVANGARAGLRRAERQAEDIFTRRGIGRSLFGGGPASGAQGPAERFKRGKSGASALINVQKVKLLKGRLLGGLYAKGLAALQEVGGRIRPHKIPRSDGLGRQVLTFGGRFVTVHGSGKFVISHPGGNLPKIPAMEPAVRQNAPVIAAEIDKRIQQSITARGL